MKMKVLAAALMAMPACANATIISGYGVEAYAWTANKCPSYCQAGQNPLTDGEIPGNSNGGEYVAAASAADNTYGSAQAYAALDGSAYLPDLKVSSSSGVGRGSGTTAFASQGYTYTGTDARTITLDINLHGIVENAVSDAYKYNSLGASVAVITGNNMEWYPSWATLVYEVATGDRLGTAHAYLSPGWDEYANTSVKFDVTPGLEFYVIAALGSVTKNGSVDAMHTLTLKFDNARGLVAAAGGAVPNAVPLPAAALLFGTGVIGFVGARRRKSLQVR